MTDLTVGLVICVLLMQSFFVVILLFHIEASILYLNKLPRRSRSSWCLQIGLICFIIISQTRWPWTGTIFAQSVFADYLTVLYSFRVRQFSVLILLLVDFCLVPSTSIFICWTIFTGVRLHTCFRQTHPSSPVVFKHTQIHFYFRRMILILATFYHFCDISKL